MNSQHSVTIYISAPADLMAERETIARMIAALPVTLAWRIAQSPLGDEVYEPALVREAAIHVLLIGGDIRAPLGLELYAAQQLGKVPTAFLKRKVPRTTAGDIFVKQSGLRWHDFWGPADVAGQIQTLSIAHLLQRAATYALTPPEVENLQGLQQQRIQADYTPDSRSSEAGRSAVILSPERFSPSDGILLDDI